MLHGNSEDLHSFEPLVPALAERYRVILIDTRGHGKSERGSAPLTYEQLAEDVAMLLFSMGIGRARFIGFSDGGIVALILAAHYRTMCDRLVVVGANMTPAGLAFPVRALTSIAWGVSGLIAPFHAGIARSRERLELMVKHPQLTARELGQIEAPCLVMAGEHDIIRPEETRRIAGAIPHSELVIIPRAGHGLTGKQMFTILAYMLEFLGDDWAVL